LPLLYRAAECPCTGGSGVDAWPVRMRMIMAASIGQAGRKVNLDAADGVRYTQQDARSYAANRRHGPVVLRFP